MKIKRLGDFCKLNESQMMDFNPNGHYTPKTEVELVEIVHDLFADTVNNGKTVGKDDVAGIDIDLSHIKDVTDVTRNMVRAGGLEISDFELLYLLGLDERDIKNKIFKIEIDDRDYSDGPDEVYADGYFISPFTETHGIDLCVHASISYTYHEHKDSTFYSPESDAYVTYNDDYTFEVEFLKYKGVQLDSELRKFPASNTLDDLLTSQYDIPSVFDEDRLSELIETKYWEKKQR